MTNYNMSKVGLKTTRGIERTLFAFAGIALYNVVELLVLVLVTFRRRNGLYFWSLAVSALAIAPYTLGLVIKFFCANTVTTSYILITFIVLGWQCMVTGQSVVLYSRLHLVASSRRPLRWILGMIIANWFISNVPITVFVYVANSPHAALVTRPYAVWERLQLTLYFVQELVISAVYMYEIVCIMKPELLGWVRRGNVEARMPGFPSRRLRTTRGRKTMKHLFLVNLVIILLDITLLAIEFVGHYEIQVLYKGMMYSMKLKMEFRILNQLTEIAQERLRSSQAYFSMQSDSLASPPTSPHSVVIADPWSEKPGRDGAGVRKDSVISPGHTPGPSVESRCRSVQRGEITGLSDDLGANCENTISARRSGGKLESGGSVSPSSPVEMVQSPELMKLATSPDLTVKRDEPDSEAETRTK